MKFLITHHKINFCLICASNVSLISGLKGKSLFHMQQNTVFGPGVLPDDGVQGGGGDLSRQTEVEEGHASEGRGSSGEGVL